MNCSDIESDCYIQARFDDGSIEKFAVSLPQDQSTGAFFVNEADLFVNKLLTAKTLAINVPLYQNGNQEADFDVSKLSVKKIDGWFHITPATVGALRERTPSTLCMLTAKRYGHGIILISKQTEQNRYMFLYHLINNGKVLNGKCVVQDNKPVAFTVN